MLVTSALRELFMPHVPKPSAPLSGFANNARTLPEPKNRAGNIPRPGSPIVLRSQNRPNRPMESMKTDRNLLFRRNLPRGRSGKRLARDIQFKHLPAPYHKDLLLRTERFKTAGRDSGTTVHTVALIERQSRDKGRNHVADIIDRTDYLSTQRFFAGIALQIAISIVKGINDEQTAFRRHARRLSQKGFIEISPRAAFALRRSLPANHPLRTGYRSRPYIAGKGKKRCGGNGYHQHFFQEHRFLSRKNCTFPIKTC